jgi:hypothetical protein
MGRRISTSIVKVLASLCLGASASVLIVAVVLWARSYRVSDTYFGDTTTVRWGRGVRTCVWVASARGDLAVSFRLRNVGATRLAEQLAARPQRIVRASWAVPAADSFRPPASSHGGLGLAVWNAADGQWRGVLPFRLLVLGGLIAPAVCLLRRGGQGKWMLQGMYALLAEASSQRRPAAAGRLLIGGRTVVRTARAA